jgi:hypothetical protein
MSEAASPNTNDAAPAANGDARTGKVVQLRQAVSERAGAVSDWAQGQARALANTAKEKPLATASVSAGTAFAFGVVVGLLLARAATPPEPDWKDRLMALKPSW